MTGLFDRDPNPPDVRGLVRADCGCQEDPDYLEELGDTSYCRFCASVTTRCRRCGDKYPRIDLDADYLCVECAPGACP